jgi:hypothetical protein
MPESENVCCRYFGTGRTNLNRVNESHTSFIATEYTCHMPLQGYKGSFHLIAKTIACTTKNQNDVLHVPANEDITLIGNLHETDVGSRMVEIEWQGRRLQMFSVDILERSE